MEAVFEAVTEFVVLLEPQFVFVVVEVGEVEAVPVEVRLALLEAVAEALPD